MTRHSFAFLSLTLISSAAAVTSFEAQAFAVPPSVGVTHGTIKVRPTDPTPPASSASISAARNEFEPFQIVIGGGDSGLSAVTATASPLNGPAGATIPASDVRLYREEYMNITTPTTTVGATGLWPDALVPAVDELYGETRNAFPFDVPAGQNRVIWVDVYVPQSTAPGSYSGSVTLGGALGGKVVPISLTVYPFALPSTATLPSSFGMGWADVCIAELGSYAACGDSGVVASHLRYATFLLNHRLTIDTVYTGPNTASAGGYDWATWDASYGPAFDGTLPTILPGAKETTIRYSWTGDSAHYAAWAQHFRAKGWFARTYDYTCDEPPAGCSWNALANRASIVHGGDPQFPVLVTTTMAAATANGVLSSIDWLVPNLTSLWPIGGSDTRSSYDGWLGTTGKRLFWYQSCTSAGCGDGVTTGWPDYMIDVPAQLNRAMEWASFVERTQGELYYDVTYGYTSGTDPWTNQYAFGGNGDGTLLYPGTPAKIGGTDAVPVASIRLKMIREGMEDYEYLSLLSSLGDTADAAAAALSVVTDPWTIADPGTLLAARTNLANAISARVASTTPSDTGSGQPDGGVVSAPDGGSVSSSDGSNGGPRTGATAALAGGCSLVRSRAPNEGGVVLLLLGLLTVARRRKRTRD